MQLFRARIQIERPPHPDKTDSSATDLTSQESHALFVRFRLRNIPNFKVTDMNEARWRRYTGLFKKKYKLSKIYFTKTTDAKSISCVRMERKSLKVLILMI
jgi:hypothetical protein